MTDHGQSHVQSTPLLRKLSWLPKIQLRLAALALVAMMVVTVADVFLRYVFNNPIRGSYDFVESMLVVFVFNGMSAGFFRRQYIVIDLIDHLAPARLTKTLIKIADLVCVVALLLLARAMLRPALQAYAYGDTKIDLGLPIYVLWIVAGIGMAGTIMCALAVLFLRPDTIEHRSE